MKALFKINWKLSETSLRDKMRKNLSVFVSRHSHSPEKLVMRSRCWRGSSQESTFSEVDLGRKTVILNGRKINGKMNNGSMSQSVIYKWREQKQWLNAGVELTIMQGRSLNHSKESFSPNNTQSSRGRSLLKPCEHYTVLSFTSTSLPPLRVFSSCCSYCWRCLKLWAEQQRWTSPSSQPSSLCRFTCCVCCSPPSTSWCAHRPKAPATSAASPGLWCLPPLPFPQLCFVFWSPWQCVDCPRNTRLTGRWVVFFFLPPKKTSNTG